MDYWSTEGKELLYKGEVESEEKVREVVTSLKKDWRKRNVGAVRSIYWKGVLTIYSENNRP